MSEYDDCSREELIEQIERLKRENAALSSGQKASRGGARRMLADSPGGFRDKYAAQILESLPDMLTVLDHSGQLVDLVSSEETNHVGAPSDSLIGRDICTLLSPEAYHNVKENLDYVVRNKIGSTSHHDITLDNHTRHYENRIFPLDDEHALCMCRDVTDQVIVQQELEQANLRMVAAEDIALLSHWYYYEDIKEFEAPKIIPWLVGGGDGKLKRCRKELFLSHVHPADRDALLNQLRYGQAGDGYVEYRISVQGQTRYYHSRILRIIRKEDGSRIIEGYAQDMTYVVKRLHDFEAVKYALNNAVEEIYSCDLEGTLEFANQRFIERHNLSGDISNYKLYERIDQGQAARKNLWMTGKHRDRDSRPSPGCGTGGAVSEISAFLSGAALCPGVPHTGRDRRGQAKRTRAKRGFICTFPRRGVGGAGGGNFSTS